MSTVAERMARWPVPERTGTKLPGCECQQIDQQLTRLKECYLHRRQRSVGVGKSSLINALVGRSVMTTDVLHGSTRHDHGVDGQHPFLAGTGRADRHPWTG